MQKSNSNMTAKTTRRKVKSSTTLNRRYVRQPKKNMTMDSFVSDQTIQKFAPMQQSQMTQQPQTGQQTQTMQQAQVMEQLQMMQQTKTKQSTGMRQTKMAKQAKTQHIKIQRFAPQQVETAKIEEKAKKINVMADNSGVDSNTFSASPVQSIVSSRMKMRQNKKTEMATMASSVSAKELKERAIQKALASASAPVENKSKKQRVKQDGRLYFGFGRVMLALACAAATAFAIVYFVDLNMPDISLKVAAMQTGINASYPGYVPRDFSISSITSESGKITLDFKNNNTGDAFSLVEEASSWDSNALMTNYVKDEFSANYTAVKEQGITIYIDGSDAAWVNGGIVYKLDTTAGNLTNKQIKSIAVSLK